MLGWVARGWGGDVVGSGWGGGVGDGWVWCGGWWLGSGLMVVGIVVVALGGMVVVRLLGGGGWDSVGGTIGLIFSPTYAHMYFCLPNG